MPVDEHCALLLAHFVDYYILPTVSLNAMLNMFQNAFR